MQIVRGGVATSGRSDSPTIPDKPTRGAHRSERQRSWAGRRPRSCLLGASHPVIGPRAAGPASSREGMRVPLRMRERGAAPDAYSSSNSAGKPAVARRAAGVSRNAASISPTAARTRSSRSRTLPRSLTVRRMPRPRRASEREATGPAQTLTPDRTRASALWPSVPRASDTGVLPARDPALPFARTNTLRRTVQPPLGG
jgi:hypothetical protein